MDESFEPPSRVLLRRLWRAFEGPDAPTGYWLTRSLILRGLGAIYLVAFATGVFQLEALVGENGLLPAADYLASIDAGFWDLPTIFWWDASDAMLVGVCVVGMILAAMVVAGLTNSVAMLLLWALYMSVDHVGQRWYAFGWENQLLETGFLAIFLCSPIRWRPFDRRAPPSRALIWLMRWLVFRIMLGAGLIKLRGDPCWSELTCLDYHFETQPIPNPVSWWLHHSPKWLLAFGVAVNHFVELVVPLFVFGPRRLRIAAGVLLVGFQLFLVVSGNLSFLNWLTIVSCLACFDDRVFPARLLRRLSHLDPRAAATQWTKIAVASLSAVIIFLSFPVVANLFADRQVMNRSFDRLHIVNTYGAFGSVGRTRLELVFEGTRAEVFDDDARWLEYEFECKPGDPRRRPCVVSPYHYRLDWLVWFAALDVQADGRLQREDWVVHFIAKLLHADPAVLDLLEHDPFSGERPAYVRVLVYEYRFSTPDEDPEQWWVRTPLGELVPPLARDTPVLTDYLEQRGWTPSP